MFKILACGIQESMESRREQAFHELTQVYSAGRMVVRKMKPVIEHDRVTDWGLDRVFDHAPGEDPNRPKACTLLLPPELRDKHQYPTRTYQFRGLSKSSGILMDADDIEYVLGSKTLMASNFFTSDFRVANFLFKIKDHQGQNYKQRYRRTWFKTFDSLEGLTDAMKTQKLGRIGRNLGFYRSGEVLFRELKKQYSRGILLDHKATPLDIQQATVWQQEIELSFNIPVPIVKMLKDGSLEHCVSSTRTGAASNTSIARPLQFVVNRDFNSESPSPGCSSI